MIRGFLLSVKQDILVTYIDLFDKYTVEAKAMKYTLRQLEIFLAIAKHQNISKAAEELHMSQSAASSALQNLEHAYEISLFDRQGKKLVLNATGDSLRAEAENLLIHCESFENHLLKHNDFGHLKIGASFTIGNHLLPKHLADYLAEYPDANIDFDIANTPDIAAKVLNYEVDIGMIEGEVQHKGLNLIPWKDDELVVFCSANHPYAKKKHLSNKDIKEAQWILREPDSGARHTFDKAFSDLMPDLNIFLEFKHNEAIKKAVEAGLGIGCLSHIVLQNNFDYGDLIPLSLPKRKLSRTFYFALTKAQADKHAVNRWIELCENLNTTNASKV